MVLVVLGAFAAGLAIGVLGMVPRWLRQRSAAHTPAVAVAQAKPVNVPKQPVAGDGYADSSIHGI
jgi:hypothetical protein